MVLFLCRICHYELHVVLCSHIGILMPLLAEEPHSTACLSFRLSVFLWNDLANYNSYITHNMCFCSQNKKQIFSVYFHDFFQ